MSKRVRNYVVALVSAVLGFAYGKLSSDWSGVELFGGLATVVAVIVLVGLPWLEMAPDGAFRRKPRA
jgi:hypothetical protein